MKSMDFTISWTQELDSESEEGENYRYECNMKHLFN